MPDGWLGHGFANHQQELGVRARYQDDAVAFALEDGEVAFSGFLAVDFDFAEEETLKKGMEEKSNEFEEKGAAVYVKA